MRRIAIQTTIGLSFGLMLFATAWPPRAVYAQTQPQTPTTRPAYQSLRYDEDWTFLRDPARRTDPWDRVKFVPLGRDAHLTIGGEVRLRLEGYDDPGFGAEPSEPPYALHRLLVHADAHLGPHVRLFAQLQSSTLAGRNGGPRPTDRDDLDVQQAFVDLAAGRARSPGVMLRIGRQELEFGSARMISTRDQLNTRLSFNALRAILNRGPWRAGAYVMQPVRTATGLWDNRGERERTFWGGYLARSLARSPGGNAVLFYVGLRRDHARFDGGAGDERRHTIGVRVWARGPSWDYNNEGSFQFGRLDLRSAPASVDIDDGHRAREIRAWDIATDHGWTWRRARWTPRIGLRLDVTSGTRHRDTGPIGTFNTLFAGTAYSGLAGLIGPANAIDLAPSVLLRPHARVSVTLGAAHFWRYSREDGIYGITLNPVRPSGASDARHIGNQFTLQAAWTATSHVTFSATVSTFLAGRFLRESAPGDDVRFVTAWMTYMF